MNLKIISNKFYLNLTVIFSIFILDRLTKIYVIYLDKLNSGSEIFSSKFLNIQLIWNEGVAFGLFAFDKDYLYNILTIIIFIIVVIIFFILSKSVGLKKYSLLMILGGALGNVFDRVYYRSVADFIDFHIENFHWFIFNVADIFITIGIIIMIILEIVNNNKENRL